MPKGDNTLLAPCREDKPFIFISYSHKNSNEVVKIISRLQKENYNVWYDAGIDPGTEWDENIAAHVKSCSYFIAFISKEYLASSNCRDELNFARDAEKQRLLVYLHDTPLPDGMGMRLNRLQAIHKYTYKNEEEFYSRLFAADGINACLNKGGEDGGNIPAQPFPAAQPQVNAYSSPDKKKFIIIAAAAIAAVIALSVGITAAVVGGRNESVPSVSVSNDNDAEKETVKETEEETEAQTLKETEKPVQTDEETTASSAPETEAPSAMQDADLLDNDLIYLKYNYGDTYDTFMGNNDLISYVISDEDASGFGIRSVLLNGLEYNGLEAALFLDFTHGYGLTSVTVSLPGDHRDEVCRVLTDSFGMKPEEGGGVYHWDDKNRYISASISFSDDRTHIKEYKNTDLDGNMFMRGHKWGDSPDEIMKTEGISNISDFTGEETTKGEREGTEYLHYYFENVYLNRLRRNLEMSFTNESGSYELQALIYSLKNQKEYDDCYKYFSKATGAPVTESDGFVMWYTDDFTVLIGNGNNGYFISYSRRLQQ